MPPGRPALVVVSLGLAHNKRYGVGRVQGAQSLSGNCLLHSAISSISSVRLAHPPDRAGTLEAKVNMTWLVEASWPRRVDHHPLKESASVGTR
jgi:hypothetical protein